jgi:sporulation-control protein spo0M
MFAYFTKINNKEILYFNEDDSDDDEYLFNKQTIANWAIEYNIKIQPQDEIVVREDIPPLFSYS